MRLAAAPAAGWTRQHADVAESAARAPRAPPASASARWMSPSVPPGLQQRRGGRRPRREQARRADMRVARGAHPAIAAAALAVEGRVHQHPVGLAVRDRRVAHAAASEASPATRRHAAGESGVLRQARAPRSPQATRSASRSTPIAGRARRPRRDRRTRLCPTPAPRSIARPSASPERAPAEAPRRARRGGPSAAGPA